tara:strand:+ start:228 stop:1121 length:894 start_codon:yes stop_codon:yes gene_type:complete
MSDELETTETTTAEAPSEAVSTGEPVAAGEPVASAEPTSQEDAAPVGELPSADDFDWDSWGGSYEEFDERLRPWGERLHAHYDVLNEASSERAIAQALEDQAQWKNMYNAMAMGEEDPRVAQMGTELSQKNSYLQQMESKMAEQRTAMEQLANSEATRYMDWFESVYAGRLKENPKAAERSLPLLALEGVDIPPHEAFELALLGESAVEVAIELIKKGNSIPLVKEVLQLRNRGEVTRVPVAPQKPSPKPTQSASLVTGAEETAAPPRPTPKKSTRDMPRHEARMAAVDAIFSRLKL